MVEVAIWARADSIINPVLFSAGVVIEDGETRGALLQLVKIILGSLHRLVDPEDVAGEAVELLNFVQADELKRRGTELNYFQRLIDATVWKKPQTDEDYLEVVPDS